MIKDFLVVAKEFLKNLITSRLFGLSIFFIGMAFVLFGRLFELQIIQGESYLNDYTQMTEKTVSMSGTRGNIYDRSGNLLAYNELTHVVTIQDTGDYSTSNEMNTMLLHLVRILNKHGQIVEGEFEIGIDEQEQMYFTSSSESSRLRFLRDFFGLKSVEELSYESDEDNYAYISAYDAYLIRAERYGLDEFVDEEGNPVELTQEEALQIVAIRYTMSLTAFRKYESTQITSYISEEAVAEIMENAADLKGVAVEEATIRVYNDSIYFAHIIGYTGSIQEDQLEELRKIKPEYEITDKVGRTGIEASMEIELSGGKGYQELIVNNVGRILEVVEEQEPTTGNDIYLTVDRDLQIGIYHLIEKQLAGILASKLINEDVDPYDYPDASKLMISVKDAYFQLINNNVLSLTDMGKPDAKEFEREIYSIFTNAETQVYAQLEAELFSQNPRKMNELPNDMAAYMVYIYNHLSEESVGIIDRSLIDLNSEEYLAWKKDEISLKEYIYAGISDNWINTSHLDIENRYSDVDSIYEALVYYTLEELKKEYDFSKKIIQYLIENEVLTGRQLCLALYEQEVLEYDESQINNLRVNGEDYAFSFIRQKILDIEITPAQLALDPATGSVVITNVKTGEVQALVSYPSYDNNKLSGIVDAKYYNQLQSDLSLPLYNNATQAKKAPGSTFKPLTALAGLAEGVVSPYETITCTGTYDVVEPHINCWIYPGSHGEQNLEEALQNSCNYYFTEIAHRMSTDADTLVYSTDMGIDVLRSYSALFGLDRPSGIELSETKPEMTTEDPERSSIGQGTNSYSNVQLSRYVTALANRGSVYELSLIDKISDYQGNLLEDKQPIVADQIVFPEENWDVVHKGMRSVISDGSPSEIFSDLPIEIAGKTGTAQESKIRANHAFFISFAPYTDPDIAITVNIPYGYTSSNAASVAKNVYQFYYGFTDLDYIQNTGALDVSNVTIGD